MKHWCYFLPAFILLSCQQPFEKDDLLGTWDIVSATDLETGEEELPPPDEAYFVEIRTDSIYTQDGWAGAWELEGDSIRIDGIGSVFIKKLTSTDLTVEHSIYMAYRLTLRKRK